MRSIQVLTLAVLLTFGCSDQEPMRPDAIEEPRQIILHGISVSEVPQTSSNGEAWDEDSPPDVFISFGFGPGSLISYSDTLLDLENTVDEMVIYSAPSIATDAPSFTIDYQVFDSDFIGSGVADDLITAGQARLYGPLFSEVPTSIVSGNELKVRWNIEYVY